MTKYYDDAGNPTSLYKFVRSEPDWAQSRIETMGNEINQQQKLIDKLTTALKEIKKVAGGSASDGSSAMDSQLGDIWLKADEVLENRND